MELFYAYETDGRICRLDAEESAHCVRVLRHRAGDSIRLIDGEGTMYLASLCDDNPKGAAAEILETHPHWHEAPYRLTVGCCPTKNNERFEWFVEKATEVGVHAVVPLIGEHSERKVYKADRARRIALAAAKQSLKARIPLVREPVPVKDFLREERSGCKLIACCFEDGTLPRRSIAEVLREAGTEEEVTVLIGPEGDFSPEEVRTAIENGYRPVHLGPSRLRTETAALTAAEAVYFRYL